VRAMADRDSPQSCLTATKDPLQAGGLWYAVPASWFRQWLRLQPVSHEGAASAAAPPLTPTAPGPIDTASLLSDRGGPELRPGLVVDWITRSCLKSCGTPL